MRWPTFKIAELINNDSQFVKKDFKMADNLLNKVDFSAQSGDLIDTVCIDRGLQKSYQNAPSHKPAKLRHVSSERPTGTKKPYAAK